MSEVRAAVNRIKSKDNKMFRYILARLDSDNVSECSKVAGVSRSWWYQLSDNDREEIENSVIQLREAKVYRAMMILEDSAVKAAQVLADDINTDDKRLRAIRQSAAKDILDRTGASDKVDRVEHKGVVGHIDVGGMLNKVYGKNRDNGKVIED